MSIAPKIIFTKKLSATQHREVVKLYGQFQDVSLEQYPGFAQAADPDISVYYLLAYRGETLYGYASVKVKRMVMASVVFGPLVTDRIDYSEVSRALIDQCRSRGILVVRITPPYMYHPIVTAADLCLSNNELHWHTLKLDLSLSEDEIWQKISPHHKRNITKAKNMSLVTSIISDRSLIVEFAGQYTKMYLDRGLAISPDIAQKAFEGVFDFFSRTGSGYFMSVTTVTGEMIGGICISYQGESAFYYKGYASIDHRRMPISHLAFYDAILKAKRDGMKYFDFGGYAPDISIDDQLYSINRFKKGFNGVLTTYPKSIISYTLPGVRFLYELFKHRSQFSLKQIMGRRNL